MPETNKLPKWAQAHISRIERERDAAKEAVARLAPDEKTAVTTDPYGNHGGTVGVAPRGEYVRFHLDGVDGYRWLDVRVNHEGTGFDLMASSVITVEHRASNTAGIGVR